LINNPLGDPENLVSNRALEDKFYNLSNDLLDDDNIKLIIDKIWNLEKVSNVRELTELLLLK
jgi:hypothetical protein